MSWDKVRRAQMRWTVECEECSVKCGAWRVQCEVWSVKFGVWSAKCEVWTVKCEVWSVDCEVWSVQCEVWSVRFGLWRKQWEVRSGVSLNYRSFIFGKLPPPACPGLCYGLRKNISSQAAVPTSVAQKRGLCFVGTLSATLAIVQVKGLALDFPMTGILHGSIWPPRPVGICGGHKRCMSMLKWAKMNSFVFLAGPEGWKTPHVSRPPLMK